MFDKCKGKKKLSDTKSNTIKSLPFVIIAGIILMTIIAVATTIISDSTINFGNVKVNDSGIYYGNTKSYVRTADVVVCKGTSTAEDAQLETECDIVCKSIDNDCSQEIQVAVDTGSTLIKKGRYELNNTIIIRKNITVSGEGWETQLNVSNGFNNKTIILIGGLTVMLRYPILKNVMIDGNYRSNYSIYVDYVTWGKLENIYVEDNKLDGIVITSSTSTTSHFELNNVASQYNLRNGFSTLANSEMITFYNTISYINQERGYSLASSGDVYMLNSRSMADGRNRTDQPGQYSRAIQINVVQHTVLENVRVDGSSASSTPYYGIYIDTINNEDVKVDLSNIMIGTNGTRTGIYILTRNESNNINIHGFNTLNPMGDCIKISDGAKGTIHTNNVDFSKCVIPINRTGTDRVEVNYINQTLIAPNSTKYCCGVKNDGNYNCTLGYCT